MNKNHVITILKAFKKDAISEEEAVEVLLEMAKNQYNTFTTPWVAPESSSAGKQWYINYKNTTDSGDMR